MTKKLTMADIRHNSKEAGSPFFSRNNTKFLDSKTLPYVYQGDGIALFITSDRQIAGCGRWFKIWGTHNEGRTIHVRSAGFRSLELARDAAKDAIRGK